MLSGFLDLVVAPEVLNSDLLAVTHSPDLARFQEYDGMAVNRLRDFRIRLEGPLEHDQYAGSPLGLGFRK